MLRSDYKYMDDLLRRNLPIELVEIIMRQVHKSYMNDLCIEIINNVVWVRTKANQYSFLIGKTQNNPYYVLRIYE